MATSEGGRPGVGRRVWRYLESTRNLVGFGGAIAGVGLHIAGLGGSLWPGVVVGLYGIGALLTPGPKDPDGSRQPPNPTPQPPVPEASGISGISGLSGISGASGLSGVSAGSTAPPPAPRPDPELEALAAYLDSAELPPSAKVDDLVDALRAAGSGPVAERIVRHRLPVAVAGYLRARTWQPWAGPDAPDPEAELAREVDRLAADLA
ncbi:hypothetical protein [Kitasatospora sp. NPDC097643]|uniref:hypothetical protein n=1 Tax=Kitasatospora sp. NPDC097643 TaxID=3157230 RepID=UPI0033202342